MEFSSRYLESGGAFGFKSEAFGLGFGLKM